MRLLFYVMSSDIQINISSSTEVFITNTFHIIIATIANFKNVYKINERFVLIKDSRLTHATHFSKNKQSNEFVRLVSLPKTIIKIFWYSVWHMAQFLFIYVFFYEYINLTSYPHCFTFYIVCCVINDFRFKYIIRHLLLCIPSLFECYNYFQSHIKMETEVFK